jgi:hypothetical protein
MHSPHRSERLLAVDAQLAFTRPEHVTPAGAGPSRARTLDAGEAADPRSYDLRRCRIADCGDEFRPDLREHGFSHVDLSRMHALQAALERVRAAAHLGDADAAEIRRRLLGRALPLPDGARLWLLFIARDGFFMRRAGPNGLPLYPAAHQLGRNGHDAARTVHADQDVDGTPVRQILRGAAPWLFHHDSPRGANRRSRLHLLNLWIPLEQVTRPLALMDTRTVDRRAHQLRYGLPTDTFLRRDEDMRVNDIWTFLHDDAQRWYFTADMDPRRAYVFETLGTPHGSFIVPGEERAESSYRRLTAAVAAARDEAAFLRALNAGTDPPSPEPGTEPLRRAIAAMDELIREGRLAAPAICRDDPRGWLARAAQAAERVVRKSLEMRAIALLTPPLWPRR